MGVTLNFEKSFEVEGGSFQNAGNVSGQIKGILKDLGVSTDIVRRIAIICYESEINIVSYAKRGTITLSVTDEAVKIEAKDEGPGIPDIELAMQEGYSTASPAVREMGFGAGMGLANMKKYSDHLIITSELGVGTNVRMTVMNFQKILHPDLPQITL
ncbi:MAG: anti-sigma regulatory factor [Syntrophaceae bacterium]|nr:anti-sigma regulatory factor [Syntrophaceae bacterium]